MEQEQTLEELGKQLSVSKLQICDLKEEASKNRIDGAWAKDKNAATCKCCNKEFSLTRRRVSSVIGSGVDTEGAQGV